MAMPSQVRILPPPYRRAADQARLRAQQVRAKAGSHVPGDHQSEAEVNILKSRSSKRASNWAIEFGSRVRATAVWCSSASSHLAGLSRGRGGLDRLDGSSLASVAAVPRGAPIASSAGRLPQLLTDLAARRLLDRLAHRLLEDGQQGLGGERAQPLERLAHLRPVLLGAPGLARTASRPSSRNSSTNDSRDASRVARAPSRRPRARRRGSTPSARQLAPRRAAGAGSAPRSGPRRAARIRPSRSARASSFGSGRRPTARSAPSARGSPAPPPRTAPSAPA